MKNHLLLATTLLATTCAVHAQDATDPDLRDIGLPGLYLFPDEPRDFLNVVGIVLDNTADYLDPVPLNDLNLVFDPTDNEQDAFPVEVILGLR